MLEIAGSVKFCEEDNLFLHTVFIPQPMLALSWYCIWCLIWQVSTLHFFLSSQTICTPRFFLSAHTQFMETAMLGLSETCSGIACIISFSLRCSLHNFVSKRLNYLAALQLFIFLALLIRISLKLTSWLTLIQFVNINSPMYEQQHFQMLCSQFWQHSWQLGILCLGFVSAWSVWTWRLVCEF